MSTTTKRFRLALTSEIDKALRHAAIARETTPAGFLRLAAIELLERDGWLRATDSDDQLTTSAAR